MKIGVYLESLPPEIGGGFTFQETVLSGLDKMAGDFDFVVFHYGSVPKQFSSSKVRFHCLGKSKLRRLWQKIFWDMFCRSLQRPVFLLNRAIGLKLRLPPGSALDAAARKEQIDLIWFPTPSGQRVEAPYIMTVWDLEHRAQPYFPEVSANGEWEGRERYFSQMLARASFIITGTNVGKEEICRFYGVAPDRVRLLKHPTPEFALKNADASGTRPKDLPEGPYVLYPAQFWAHKNHGTLLKAIAELQVEGIVMNLALVGSDKGNQRQVEKLANDLGITSLVHFLGFVSRDELIYLYKNATALTYPSLCGPENLPPLEAFAFQCPVIAADIPGAREQLKDAAALTPPLNPQAWATAIKGFLSRPPEMEKTLEAAEERARAYTGEHFHKDLERIFREYAEIRNLSF